MIAEADSLIGSQIAIIEAKIYLHPVGFRVDSVICQSQLVEFKNVRSLL